MEQQNKGIVYVLTNERMPGLVKIGMTTRESINARMKELYTTGVPVPFECAYACEVDDCRNVERALHIAFGPNRIAANREFFDIEIEQAIVILKLLEKKDVTNEISSGIEKDLTPDDKRAIEKAKIEKARQSRRPSLNYKEMGINIGSKLIFTKNPTVDVVIASDKKVLYQEVEMSLTEVTKQLLGISHALQPTRYWTYEGKNLTEIYDETYPPMDED